jgi:GDP/UDP-N,N'-diacetylbacillosamine 2-epimerase (hydrolysing)
MKKICIITGTRADYGLLKNIIDGINRSPLFDLQLIATGSHLSPEFGLTYREIEADGHKIDRKLEILLSSDTAVGITKSMGLALGGFGDLFSDLKPDMLLVLGDRYEIFAAVSAAMIAGIPIAHAHGGEVTHGSIDDQMRHAITKMSCIHFVAAEEYRRRVIQLGESPESIFLVGGLGIDNIHNASLLSRTELELSMNYKFGKKNLLVTFHPSTANPGSAEGQMKEMLSALEALDDVNVVFTMPNADAEGRALFGMIESFVSRHPRTSVAYPSLGNIRYLSFMALADAVVGNSSSGLIEAPSLKTATVNIGDRQEGRLKAKSVIDCPPKASELKVAIKKVLSKEFQSTLSSVVNPYGQAGASKKIIDVLEATDFSKIKKKFFIDLIKV